MKTAVIQDSKNIKASFDLSGKFTITLVGGQQHVGEFTKDELTQIAFRFRQATNGQLDFDPAPIDIMSLHSEDMATLEKQSLVIQELREENAQLTNELASAEEQTKAFSKDLIACREQLRDSRIEVSELNAKLVKVDSGVTVTLELEPQQQVAESAPPTLPDNDPPAQESDAAQ